jgi:hypothetical protein
MDCEYDIFEKVDGELVWRSSIRGYNSTVRKIQELAEVSSNEIVAMYLPTKMVVATLNSTRSANTD